MGAAALSTGSLSVLAAAFPEPRKRAQAIGLWSGRAVAREVLEPLSLLLLTSSVNSEAGQANGGAEAASEMVPDAGETPSSGHLME
jgi:hypothetical protein